MKTRNFLRAFAGLLLTAFAVVATTSCGDDNEPPATLEVNPNSLVLDADAGAAETFAVTTSAAWTATVSGEGFTLDKTSGTGDAVITVTAAAANNEDKQKMLGSVTIAARGVKGTQEVAVSQLGAPLPDPTPADVTIVVDFAEGPGIATPALPGKSEDALSGRHEYTIKGYTFAIYADAADGGKFFWTDNSKYFDGPEPNKGLFFSKIGAYVEFPVIAGKALTTIGYAYNNGAGEFPEMDIISPDDDFVTYSLDYAEDGTGMTYTLLNPGVDVTYRLTVLDRSNAQVSKLVLVYASPQ